MSSDLAACPTPSILADPLNQPGPKPAGQVTANAKRVGYPLATPAISDYTEGEREKKLMVENKRSLQVVISENREAVQISLSEPLKDGATLNLNLNDLTNLIGALGKVRTEMLKGKPSMPIIGAAAELAINPAWHTMVEPLTERSMIAFQHTGYGAVGLLLDTADAKKLGRLLILQGDVPRQSATTRPS